MKQFNKLFFQFKKALEDNINAPLKEANSKSSIIEALQKAKQQGGKPSKPEHTNQIHKDTHWDHSNSKPNPNR